MDVKNEILIIDDEPQIREFLRSFLENESYTVIAAEDGIQGVSIAQKYYPDVILLDVMMPNMDGFETCRRLRAEPALADVPIIMLTALDTRDAKLEGLQAGADDFLVKPFDIMELRIRLKNITRMNRYRRLLMEQSRFLWLVEHSDDGYLLLNQTGEISYANAMAESLLLLPKEYASLDFADHIQQFFKPQPEDIWLKWFEYPETFYLIQPETESSGVVWLIVECMDIPLNEAHRVIRVRNVTQKMTDFQDIRRFHTFVAHKLRTPISHIAMSMNLIKEKSESVPPDQLKQLVLSAWEGAERLVVQMTDVLKYLDVSTTRRTGPLFALMEISLRLKSICEELELKEVTLHMPDSLARLTVAMPSSAMELVLEEILDNSKKFHPNHDPRIEMQINQKNEQTVLITIIDNGLTLSVDQLEWAWHPYFQGEKHFTGEIPGMGLGFPTVATLVWQSGGQLKISNRIPGPGVIVEIALPLAMEKTNV